MFDVETLKWLASLGVGGILAGGMFAVYRKDAAAWQEAWKGQAAILIQVVKENTAAMTANTAAIAAANDAIENLDRDRRAGP